MSNQASSKAFKFSSEKLPLVKRVAIFLLMMLVTGGGFVGGAKLMGLYAPLNLSIHAYYQLLPEFAENIKAHEDGEAKVQDKKSAEVKASPLLYGEAQMRAHFRVDGDNVRKFAIVDLLFPFVYGLTFMIGYRIFLLGYPRQILWGSLRERLLFFAPMTIGVISDWLENILVLFLNQGCRNGCGDISHELAAVAGVLTFVKTSTITVAYVSFLAAGFMILVRGHVTKQL